MRIKSFCNYHRWCDTFAQLHGGYILCLSGRKCRYNIMMEMNEDSWDFWFQGMSSLPCGSISRQLCGHRLLPATTANSKQKKREWKAKGERERGLVSFLPHSITLEPYKYSKRERLSVPLYSLWWFKNPLFDFFCCECLMWEELQQSAKNFVLLIHKWGVLKLALRMCSNSMQIRISMIEQLKTIW